MRSKAQQESGRGWRAAALGLVAGAQLLYHGQATSVTVQAAADTFLWSLAPGNNYGAAGALSVSGSTAANGSGQQNGLYDSLLRFPMSNVVASADGTFGTNNWVVTGATLAVTEVGEPINGMFNRGVGGFEIRWIGADGWSEGTGTPMMTTTDGIVYQDLGSVLNPASDVSLGLYTNGGVDGPISFNLPLTGALVSGVKTGRPVSLYMAAASTTVGFTFNSRNFPTPGGWPSLTLTMVQAPSPVLNISAIAAENVSVGFDTISNWNYMLQGTASMSGGVAWSNLTTVLAQGTNGHAAFVDGVTNQRRFYRLSLSR